jgi:predicted phosphodiesterase
MNVQITRTVYTENYTDLNDRIEFYKNRYIILYHMIQFSAKKRNLEIESIVTIDHTTAVEEFLVAGRINKIVEGKVYLTLHIEELHKGKSYFYKVIVKNGSELTKSLFPGLIVGILLKSYQMYYYLVDLVWPHESIRSHPSNVINTSEKKYILALSDIHIGSKLFNEVKFKSCINFINNPINKIKYLVIAGDLLDGINTFPNHVEHLDILTYKQQENKVYDWLKQIRSDVIIIISPGNHDNLKGISEPQPIAHPGLDGRLKNLICVTNPAYLKIENLLYLIYHGRSMNSFMRSISTLSVEKSHEIQMLMCKSGHISPVINSMNISKITKEDSLVIHELPHVFHVGHTHIVDVIHKEGITYVNAGTFQDETDYQKIRGIIPTVGYGVLINYTDYREYDIIQF